MLNTTPFVKAVQEQSRVPAVRCAGKTTRVFVWAVLSAALTLFVLQHSMRYYRLVTYPTQEDVTYLSDGLSRLNTFYAGGLKYLASDYAHFPPKSPVSAYMAAVAYGLFGFHDWAPYASNALIIFMLLWYVDRLLGERAAWIKAAVIVFVLAAPVASLAIQEYRPDIPCGLVTAIGFIELARAPILGATKRQMWIGIVFGLALLVKATIFPATILWFTSALGVAILRDAILLPEYRLWSRTTGRCLAVCICSAAIVASIYYVFAYRWQMTYFFANNFTDRWRIWAYGGTVVDHLRYYLDGPGGRFMLGAHLYMCLGLCTVAALVTLFRRDRREWLYAFTGAAMTAMLYALPTVAAVKDPQGAAAFVWMVILASAVMLVYILDSASTVRQALPVAWAVPVLAGGLALYHFQMPAKGGSPNDPVVVGTNEFVWNVFDTVMNKVAEAPLGQKMIFTTTYGAINYQLLKYLALREDRSPYEVPMLIPPDTTELAPFREQVRRASLVLASEPGTWAIAPMMPSTKVQGQTLQMVRDNPDFQEIAKFPTPSGTGYVLFERKGPFFGWIKAVGLTPETGPRPAENLPLFRFGVVPRTTLTFFTPEDGTVRLAISCQSRVEGQVLTLSLDQKRVGQFPIHATGRFVDGAISFEALRGEHGLTIEYSQAEKSGSPPGAVIYQRLQIEHR